MTDSKTVEQKTKVEQVEEEVTGGELLYCGTKDWDSLGKKGPVTAADCVYSAHRLKALMGVKIKSVHAGSCATQCIALDVDGGSWSWGRNLEGSLGHGDCNTRQAPTRVEAFRHHKIVDAACGKNHSLFLTEQGAVYSCGGNKSGQLGLGHTRPGPFSTPSIVSIGKVKQVSAGVEFSMALGTEGALYSWGLPEYGQLGNGVDGKYFVTASKLSFNFEASPIRVEALAGVEITQVVCGNNHTLAVDAEKKVWTWGFGGYGRLGHSEQKDEYKPRQLTFFGSRPGLGATLVAVGASCNYVHIEAGATYFFGRASNTAEAAMYPKPVHDLSGWKVRSIACGVTHTVVCADSSVIAWGPSPTTGELGYGDPATGAAKSSTKPQLMDPVEGMTMMAAACGTNHTLLIARADAEHSTKVEALPVFEASTVVAAAPSADASKKKGKAAAAPGGKGKRAADADEPAAKKKGKKK